jgi:hypothetical protein
MSNKEEIQKLEELVGRINPTDAVPINARIEALRKEDEDAEKAKAEAATSSKKKSKKKAKK